MGVPVLLRATIASIVLVGCAAPVAAKDASTLLDVWVNGRAIGKIGEFDIRGDALAASTAELAELGLAPRVVPVDGLAELVRDSGFAWKIDARSAAIYFTAADNRLVSRSFSASKSAGPALLVESGTGATISYDITALDTPFGRGASGLVEARLFSRLGLLSTDALVTSGQVGPGVAKGVVRLNSTYGLAFPNAMLRLRLGDFITSGVTSARAVRLGGIQFGSDFGLRPDLITMPLPTLRASAAVPTTADILVNGAYSSSVDVGSGPFDVQNVPVVTGAGTVSLNLRDAGGNAVSRTFAFYASNALLAPGLRTFVVQVGALRRNFGVRSNDYGPWAASASYRRGLSSRLTAEGHLELSRTTAVAQAGFSANLGNVAIATQSIAVSADIGRSGFQSISQLEHSGRVFSARLSYTMASSAFRDVAASQDAPINRHQLEANLGVSMGAYGNFSLAYARFDRRDEAGVAGFARTTVLPRTSLNLLTANYSIQRGPVSVYANAFANMGANSSRQFMLGLSFPFGRRDQVNTSLQAQGGRYRAGVQVARGTSQVEQWGYQASVWRGLTDSQTAEVQYQSRIGWMSAGLDNTDGRTSARIQMRGSVSVIDGAVYPSPTITNSFAIVDTAGMPGVEVFHENRSVGRTGKGGKLLVTDLRSFEVNHVAINPTDLPADMIVATGQRDVRPQDRSGVVLRFPLKHSNSALVRLTDASDEPLPPGSMVTLGTTGAPSPIGYDGEVFVENLSAINTLTVAHANGATCAVRLMFEAKTGDIPRLGPFACQAVSR